MPSLKEVVEYCDRRTNRTQVADFPGALNGLQVANRGKVRKIGAAVDAGRQPFDEAVAAGVDFLIVHHGLFWEPPWPIAGKNYDKLRVLLDGDCALYGSHLPLDCHPEIGNNALLAKKLELPQREWFLPYEGTNMGLIADCPFDRDDLRERLEGLFPDTMTAIECGSGEPQRVAILTGSGRSAVPEIKKHGTDTLITGELRQQHFNLAQEEGLNLYICGHYATEVFGVSALAEEVARHFGLEWEFLPTDCPL